MIDFDELDGLAAEYALGVLDAHERVDVDVRRVREPALNQAIGAWERRLAFLASQVIAINPPGELRSRLEGSYPFAGNGSSATLAASPHGPVGNAMPAPFKGTVSAALPAGSNIISLRRKVRVWQIVAAVTTAIAASLLITVGVMNTRPQTSPHQFVAFLQKDAASPAFLMTVDLDARTMTVKAVAAAEQPGKSYELWLINKAVGAPHSLGVVGQKNLTVRAGLQIYQPDVVAEATYAISLEPLGGSPSGAPTGPVLFTGKLVQSTL